MAVTIYDLAREAGVSISTVSKALSDSYTISEKTKRHVLETARRLQYKPNARARSFARQKSGTVIFATELYQNIAFENPHMFAILTGVTRSLEEKGYSVLLRHMEKGGAAHARPGRLFEPCRVALSGHRPAQLSLQHLLDGRQP